MRPTSPPALRAPLVDLRAQHATLEAEIRAEVDRVIESQAFILGDDVAQFEEAIAARIGVRRAVGVASGSDALLLALMAAGVGPGAEVVTTPFTFFATAGAVARLGARPVFVDIEPSSFNLDADAAAAAVGPRTRAILPVHLFGRCARMAPLLAVAARNTGAVAIVEDAAQAIDATHEGRAAGSLGDLGCLSFFPSKNLGAWGDGGMVLCRDPAHGERVARLRAHGGQKMYTHDEVGMNSRLDALQAAVLRVKLRHLDRFTEARRARAQRYRELFDEAGLLDVARPPLEDPAGRHVYHQFTVRCERRDALKEWLSQAGVGCAVYYPRPLHLQPCFAYLGQGRGAFPEAERASDEALSLPMYPELREDQQALVVDAIRAFYRGGA